MILAATVATASELRAQPTADAAAIPSTHEDGSGPISPVLTPRSAPEQNQHAAAATASTRGTRVASVCPIAAAPLTRPGDHGTGAYVPYNIIAPPSRPSAPPSPRRTCLVSDSREWACRPGGLLSTPWQAIDARFSVGPTNSIYTQWQFHAAYDLYLLDR